MKIRSDILRIYQSVHTWTGITTGLVLFIAFFAGALTMFQTPITQWAIPTTQTLPQVSLAEKDTLIQLAASENETVKRGFTINLDDNLSPMTWVEQGGGRGLRIKDEVRQASLNENGDLITLSTQQNVLGDLVDWLHRTAGIPGKAGHEDLGVVILGVASALYFVALVSGVIFLLPTLVKHFFALRQKKGSSRFWLDTHNLLGITSLPFHLMIAWTVVVFAFHDVMYDGLSVVYGDEPMFSPMPRSSQTQDINTLPPLSTYLQKVADTTDGYTVKSLTFSKLEGPGASLRINVVGDGKIQRAAESDIITMDPYTTDIIYSTLSTEENGLYGALVTSFFSLHFGNFANDAGRWIYFILGLMGAALFYTGNLLWLEKRRKKQPVQSRSNRVMANLTVGVCLGSVFGVAACMLSSKWLYLFNQSINPMYLTIYYAVFFFAIVYSFWKGAALSAIHLQYALAISCVGVPVTSLVMFLVSNNEAWSVTTPGAIGIEVGAIGFALLFFYGGRKTTQRAYQGDKNSIWFIANNAPAHLVGNNITPSNVR
ncbi:PepSY-associated TM helix domain-containing protein [Alteromonas sp. C1M14]|uniref:PepSY-associated TM helix domain-containing protein n=1 Tax=Alteromonas sp. C1M14 TaxID=2841567 RepID=UPI001C0A476B|nr:PepSY-associated TM helix domain-containing protein [Alteromonas sp. C1M14]MBU2979908.1 PepSY domain-containing protein [Alteromonas sp. C1M14]